MSKRNAQEMPEAAARPAARLKRDDDELSTVIPDNAPSSSSEREIPEVVPNLGVIAKLLMEDLSSDDDGTVNGALTKLANMFGTNENAAANRKEAMKLGAPLAVIQTAKKWGNHEMIQRECCRSILNLLGQVNPERNKSVLDLGGLEMIVTAMQRFPESIAVQRNCCGALGNIINGIDTAKQRFLQEMDGTALLVKAMTKYPVQAELQAWACLAFYDLATVNDLKYVIIKDGGVSAAAKVLERDFGDKTDKVHAAARNFMKELFG